MIRETNLLYLNPRDLLPSRQNVRSDPGDLAGLAETIREHGLLQPLGVTREGDAYRIVYGHRRRDAAIVVGLDQVPCIVIEAISDDDVIVQQVLENLQRLDLNDLDKARAFQRMIKRLQRQGLSLSEAQDRIGKRLGISGRQIQRYLRLLQLSPEVQTLLAMGELGVTHAQHLVSITPESRQHSLAVLAVEEHLSAEELAQLCSALQHNANIDPRVALDMLRQGKRVPIIEQRQRLNPPGLARTPLVDDGLPSMAGEPEPPGSKVPSRDDPGGLVDFAELEPSTSDRYRTRKVPSLDAFADEVGRLTRCVQDGDLQRFSEQDPNAAVKLRLVARQLRFLAEAVEALASAESEIH